MSKNKKNLCSWMKIIGKCFGGYGIYRTFALASLLKMVRSKLKRRSSLAGFNETEKQYSVRRDAAVLYGRLMVSRLRNTRT